MKKPFILIVDDEKINIDLLKAFLMSEDYHLVGALSGGEAYKIVNEKCPDLILLDVMMQGVDGFEVCKRLKQDERTKIVPIVMVTALREREYRIKGIEAGADDFLNKPVDRIELLARVKALLRIKSYHDDLLKSYQEIAEKNEKLYEMQKMKEGLIHMLVHDLSNPLMGLQGNLEIMSMEKQGFSETHCRAIEESLYCCGELRNMIQGQLDICRMGEVKLKAEKTPTDMTELINSIKRQFKRKLEKNKISASFPITLDMPPVSVDSSLIKRVIANLLDNAIRHTPAGGSIEIAVDFLSEKGTFRISVTDNGDGLDAKFHQKIFDKYEQAENSREGIRVGRSGLGLTFCKMAVEAHEGNIWVESEGAGKGSCFSFTLPC